MARVFYFIGRLKATPFERAPKSTVQSRPLYEYNEANPYEPIYHINYGDTFTPRQIAILQSEIPLEQVRQNELTLILRKAETMCDFEAAEEARCLLAQKANPHQYTPSMTKDEAIRILDQLTPWKRG